MFFCQKRWDVKCATPSGDLTQRESLGIADSTTEPRPTTGIPERRIRVMIGRGRPPPPQLVSPFDRVWAVWNCDGVRSLFRTPPARDGRIQSGIPATVV